MGSVCRLHRWAHLNDLGVFRPRSQAFQGDVRRQFDHVGRCGALVVELRASRVGPVAQGGAHASRWSSAWRRTLILAFLGVRCWWRPTTCLYWVASRARRSERRRRKVSNASAQVVRAVSGKSSKTAQNMMIPRSRSYIENGAESMSLEKHEKILSKKKLAKSKQQQTSSPPCACD